MIILDLQEFLEEIRPSIKWSASTGYHRCNGCGRQMDSTEKENHWPKHCSLSKDNTLQKLRDEVITANFSEEGKEKPTLQEVRLDWYQNQIKITGSLPIDFKATGSPIDESLYKPTEVRNLSDRDIRDLTDLFSGKLKCLKQIYTHDPIIDSIPMNDDPDLNLFDYPEWVKDHNQAISETYALGLYADSIKKGICDLPDCKCHWIASLKAIENMEDGLV